MKCLGLSAFLTITALSVAGLVSHSAAQQGPSAAPPAASPAPGPSATQPQHLRHSRGRASRSRPHVDKRDLCKTAQAKALGWQ